MRNYKFHAIVGAILLLVLATACGSASTPTLPSAGPTLAPAPTETRVIPTELTFEETIDFERDLEDFHPDDFDNPTDIDNTFFPLRPGTQYVYEGITVQGNREIPHKIVFNVTDLSKEIAGVRTVVAWVLDYSDDELVEAELAFYAQDNDGNVWFLGEYPEVYEFGKFVEAPAWITGFKGARAGIVMKAEPQVGEPSYSQGWGPAVDWTDRGQVIKMGRQDCVVLDCYEDVLVTEEFSRSEPDAFQIKYYAPGVGNIRVGWRGADATKEELELTELIQLNSQELAEIRAAALAMEEHAYEISKEVYDQTAPAEQIPTTD